MKLKIPIDKYPEKYWLKYNHEVNPQRVEFLLGKKIDTKGNAILFSLKNKVSVAAISKYDYLYSDGADVVSEQVAGVLNEICSSDPVILDSYSLFDRKAEGDWRIVAYDNEYQAPLDEPIRFSYGVADNKRLVDIFDNETFLVGMEEDFPRYSPMGDEKIKKIFSL